MSSGPALPFECPSRIASHSTVEAELADSDRLLRVPNRVRHLNHLSEETARRG
jgi:hypothetical protein